MNISSQNNFSRIYFLVMFRSIWSITQCLWQWKGGMWPGKFNSRLFPSITNFISNKFMSHFVGLPTLTSPRWPIAVNSGFCRYFSNLPAFLSSVAVVFIYTYILLCCNIIDYRYPSLSVVTVVFLFSVATIVVQCLSLPFSFIVICYDRFWLSFTTSVLLIWSMLSFVLFCFGFLGLQFLLLLPDVIFFWLVVWEF